MKKIISATLALMLVLLLPVSAAAYTNSQELKPDILFYGKANAYTYPATAEPNYTLTVYASKCGELSQAELVVTYDKDVLEFVNQYFTMNIDLSTSAVCTQPGRVVISAGTWMDTLGENRPLCLGGAVFRVLDGKQATAESMKIACTVEKLLTKDEAPLEAGKITYNLSGEAEVPFSYEGSGCYVNEKYVFLPGEMTVGEMLEFTGERSSAYKRDSGYAYNEGEKLATGDSIVGKYFLAIDKIVVLPGDADCDGNITTTDARLALMAAAKLLVPQRDDVFAAMDVDFDDNITVDDARGILRCAAKLINSAEFLKNAPKTA